MARKVEARGDVEAADLIRKLMVREGLTPERLAPLIKARGVKAGFPPSRVKVHPDSIRLILDTGHIPGPRIKFAIALYFGLEPGHIWEEDSFDLPVPLPPLVAA